MARELHGRQHVDEGATEHCPVDDARLACQQLYANLSREGEANQMRPPCAHSGADELRYRVSGSAHVERTFIEASAVLGEVRDQAMILRQQVNYRLPRPATHQPAVKEDDNGTVDWTGFAHEKIHVRNGIRGLRTIDRREGTCWR
jgi:hypothetical protein